MSIIKDIEKLEEKGLWQTALLALAGEFNRKPNKELAIRLLFVSWYVLIKWGALTCNEDTDWELFVKHYKGAKKFLITNYANDPEVNFYLGYMISLLAWRFDDSEKWEKKASQMLAFAAESEPDDPIYQMVYLGNKSTGGKKYEYYCKQARKLVTERYSGKGEFNLYFRHVLFSYTEWQNYWFRAKRYGWGWGLPLTWQGWIIVIAYSVMITVGIFVFPTEEKKALFICWLVGFTIILLVICWIKGEPNRWRWGNDMNQIKATFLKLILSYLKSEWDLVDYPIQYRYQPSDKNSHFGRLQPIPWTAQIVNWWTMTGHGQTKKEAFEDLHRNFEAKRVELSSLPRPGTRVPIEFDSTVQIEDYEMIAREFLLEIFDLDYEDYFISDESSLWDLHGDETNDYYYDKIQQEFGVDVSDIEGAKLCMIFRRIHEHRNSA
jgi:hypothetical protein